MGIITPKGSVDDRLENDKDFMRFFDKEYEKFRKKAMTEFVLDAPRCQRSLAIRDKEFVDKIYQQYLKNKQ